MLLDEAVLMLGGNNEYSESNMTLNKNETRLELFVHSMERLFPSNSTNNSMQMNNFHSMNNSNSKTMDMNDYKVYICEQEVTTMISGIKQVSMKRVINFWAFSPGIALEDLKRLQVRSIIITSGTLSPLDSFKEDMKLPFQIQLENNHVIKDNQIWVGAINKGINGNVLNSGYQNRDNNNYKDELCSSIITISQNTGEKIDGNGSLTNKKISTNYFCNG